MYFKSFLVVIIAVAYYAWNKRQPGNNGLGFSTTADEAIRPNAKLDGKNIIVTGGYSGIGALTVETLAKYKTSLWLPARPESLKTCQSFIDTVVKNTGNKNIYCSTMDLSSLDSVAAFVKDWKKQDLPLHILINNAGIMGCPYEETAEGFELQFATNHLGHFLLTNLLMENLEAGKPSRVVSVSSGAHHMSGVNFDDLNGKGTWYNGNGTFSFTGPWIAYGQSKSANILFAVELDKRMREFGTAYSLHPGSIDTNLQKHAKEGSPILFNVIHTIVSIIAKTPSQGAATQLYVATAPELEGRGGTYYEDCNEVLPRWYAMDPILAQKLWTLSEEATAKYLH